MTRTDTHRPAEFDPADYEVIGYIDTKKPEYIPGLPVEMYERAVAAWQEDIFRYFPDFRTGGTDHRSIHVCNHCGHSGLRWVAVVEHGPTGAKLAFGEICADRVDLPGRSAFQAKFIKDKAAREKAAFEKEAARTQFAADNSDVIEFLTDARESGREKFDFVLDIAAKFASSGSLTEAQTDAIRRIMVKRAEQQAQRDAEPKPATPLPDGRIQVEGEVVSHKIQDGMYGSTHKMLVCLDDGNKVWGTVPTAIEDALYILDDEGFTIGKNELKGQRVRFTATVERSRDDKHFGFYKRPVKPELVPVEAA